MKYYRKQRHIMSQMQHSKLCKRRKFDLNHSNKTILISTAQSVKSFSSIAAALIVKISITLHIVIAVNYAKMRQK